MNLLSLKGNSKLGTSVATTTLPILSTCSTECMHHPDREATCYAYQGPMMWHQKRMEKEGLTQWEIANLEYAQVSTIPAGRLVRLHVAGEWISKAHIKSVAKAVKARALKAWSYTHKWNQFKATDFKGMSVLASCETVADTVKAWMKGYAPALVVSKFERETAYPLRYPDTYPSGSDSGMMGIPCPAQTRNRTCEECQLCLKTDWLRNTQHVILFEPHGSRGRKLAEKLVQIEMKG